METQIQPAPPLMSDEFLESLFQEQRRRRATMSAEEFEEFRKQAARELIEITERSGAYAEAQGMTDELLEQLLADES